MGCYFYGNVSAAAAASSRRRRCFMRSQQHMTWACEAVKECVTLRHFASAQYAIEGSFYFGSKLQILSLVETVERP